MFTVSSLVPQIPCSFQPQVNTEPESENINEIEYINTYPAYYNITIHDVSRINKLNGNVIFQKWRGYAKMF